MDLDVIQIVPASTSISNSLNEEQVNEWEVIDVDQYETVLKGVVINSDICSDYKELETECQLCTSPSHDLSDPDSVEVYEDDDEYYQYDYDSGEIDPSYLKYQEILDSKNLPTDVEVAVPWFPGAFTDTAPKASGSNSSLADEVPLTEKSSTVHKNAEDYLREFVFFKRFDTVEDCSDNYFLSRGSSTKQRSKHWAKKIQEDWKILENDLPDTIFVRVYESRLDILRAVIIGAEGTPYHDGLFFFDVFYPDGYPHVPPKVHYHSGGLRINPNLYNCGKVCLSLLGTWGGAAKEQWQPGVSTMLQVLVSIQALILNQKPYFNEPGYESTMGTQEGQNRSEAYSEDAFLLSLKTMMYNMKRPPKNFEKYVYGHFYGRAHDILAACKAYKDGAAVGSLVKGSVQDEKKSTQNRPKRCSKKFSFEVSGYIKDLVKEFTEIGVTDIDKVLTKLKI